MNKTKLKQEGEKWVNDGIITDDQLDKILQQYVRKDPNIIIILFAVLLTGLGFLTFIMSDWAQVAHFSRIIVFSVVTVGLYVVGDMLYRKRSSLLGVSFIVLGYVVFGAGMLLTIDIFNITLYQAWPFLAWSIIGLLLYYIYDHKLLFAAGMIVTIAGQIYSGSQFSSFDWLLLVVLILGYGHFTYHRAYPLFGYLFGISFSIQMVVLTIAESHQYYWLLVYFLAFYIAGDLLRKQTLSVALKYISLLSVFIFGMYQTFLLQETFFMDDLEYQWTFIVVWMILFGLAIWIKFVKKIRIEAVDFILFLPVAFLPLSYVLSLAVLFIFSLAWLFVGYNKGNQEKIMLGTIAFLFSTFTVYIQYAWDAMNKSLFFLIGGILLFVISFFIERQRRALMDERKGGSGE
ncbi:DUF2157 domain-containing protein [Virgibacillus byunsanensis]|uniref:DUF2157 domain-containing protein n=1 Tax=Virgibacillus byunsanensis TaxID=570945 RepID=A0ABW3LKZ1_9BACI